MKLVVMKVCQTLVIKNVSNVVWLPVNYHFDKKQNCNGMSPKPGILTISVAHRIV